MQIGMPLYSHELRNGKEATVTVQGEGVVKAKPDVVVLTIGVRTEGTNVKQAQEENAALSTKLLDSLKQLGITEQNIKTLSYTITPQYEYVNEKAMLRGYQVEHLYEIIVLNVQKAGEVYEAAVANGANVAKGLVFRVSEPNAYYKQALVLAVQNAQEKARTIASTYNLNVNPIPISVVEESSHMPREFVAYSAVHSGAPPIQSGELEIISTVRAIFTYI
ncbi:26 kDa periplasmic immunogenic protein [Bacillus rhizoplanae]|uniref:26 kDa periplasmic immunogenic protein n=1 Tax=Bacillus rhizoplanae TaxID=2880966 RepID=A0ABN7ZPQ9_9BACI|nr:SIMPL domain-containing protein [Bacillus rhizoplanae]CAG9610902.1 26 kDa periplasmic immunogenic protein [Bacillus rhizoplanae]